MKRLMRMFIAVIMCLGFAGGFLGCETDEAGSPPAEIEKVIPQGEETMPPGEEALPAPEERRPQGETERK